MKTATPTKLQLISEGWTAADYLVEFKRLGICVCSTTEAVILKGFDGSKNGTIFDVTVMQSCDEKEGVTLLSIYHKMDDQSLWEPPLEVALLLRKRLSDGDVEDMGLKSIEVLHRPVTLDRASKIPGMFHLTLSKGEIGVSGTHSFGTRYPKDGIAVLNRNVRQ
ncbi:MAG TPA: hypothetical protein VJH55_02790 [Candidatus Paceibacterota bacterium]